MTPRAEKRESLQFQGAACDICDETYPRGALDSNHWCDECRPRMLRRMRMWRHVVALTVALPIAAWVFLHPAFDLLPITLWALFVIAAYYLGYRLGPEVLKVYTRLRRGG